MDSWRRIPAGLRAIVVGLAVGLAGSLPWAALIATNLRHLSNVPWAAFVMSFVLVAWWLYCAKGRGWPEATCSARRLGGRANRVPDRLWGPALGAGALGLFAVLLLQGVLARLVTLPQQQDVDPSKYPILTVFVWVTMSAAVAGIVEETAFRGYIQGGIERRHGLTAAILVTGVLFGLSHFGHPEVGLVLMPYYIAVAAVYGLVAAATDSTYPSMVLHAGGNVFSAFGLFLQGRSEWQLTAAPPRTIWQTGMDASFLGNLAMFVLVGLVAAFLYRELFKTARLGATRDRVTRSDTSSSQC